MLVTVSVTFIVLTGPGSVLYFITETPHPLVRGATHSLAYLNHAINGVLYCIVGSRFRNELVKTLTCCKRIRKHRVTIPCKWVLRFHIKSAGFHEIRMKSSGFHEIQWISGEIWQISCEIHPKPYKSKCFNQNYSV